MRRILEIVKERLGYSKAVEVLNISKGVLHNYLHGVRRVSVDVAQKALQYLDESEFKDVVQSVELLKAIGIVKGDGAVDYSIALQVLSLVTRDEHINNAIMQFIVRI